jgi:hypothetical protein
MVRAPPPKASNSVARRLASSKSAAAMASKAVTAASAAATLVPFEISSGAFAGEGRLEELFDRMARRVAILDGRDLLGHRSSPAVVGGSLDKASHRCDLSSELRPGQPHPQRAFTHAKRALGP